MKFLQRKVKQIKIEIGEKGFKQVDEQANLIKWSEEIQDDCYKIYVIKIEDEIIYVGETRSPLSSRLGTGFRAFQKEGGVNGYHGYKWINNFKNSKKLLTVNVFRFEHLKDCSELNDFFDDLGLQVKDKRKTIIEAIEAEIVFNVRNETGQWCKFQHEIHFHNLGDVIKNVAYKIYEF